MPSQLGQTRGTVPLLAPVPRQARHGASPASRSETVAPSMASPKLSDASVSTSAPRRGLAWVPAWLIRYERDNQTFTTSLPAYRVQEEAYPPPQVEG